MTPGVRMTMVKRDSWRLCFPFSFFSFHSFYPNSLLSATLPLAWGIGGGGSRVIEQTKAFFVSAGTIRNILIGLIIFFYLFIITTTKSYYKLFAAAYYLLLNSRPIRRGLLLNFSFPFFLLCTHPLFQFYLSCVLSFVSWEGGGGWGETEEKSKQAILVAKKGEGGGMGKYNLIFIFFFSSFPSSRGL